ncbi:MAG: hypothetical protein KBG92_06240 [Spirochaetes bacterium]|jgi:hypothetical protein|nr:hypothetical protein [Spirochaetota bacterium]
MADFVDFVSKEAGNRQLGKKFIELLNKGNVEDLKKFFDENGYTGISLNDCKTLIKNKDNIINAINTNVKDY